MPAVILPELVREYSSERQSIQNYASVLYNTILSNEQLEVFCDMNPNNIDIFILARLVLVAHPIG